MISITTKALIQDCKITKFELPKNVILKFGEYEVIIVFNTVPLQVSKKRNLTFSEHKYQLKESNTTFSREDIYENFGR